MVVLREFLLGTKLMCELDPRKSARKSPGPAHNRKRSEHKPRISAHKVNIRAQPKKIRGQKT